MAKNIPEKKAQAGNLKEKIFLKMEKYLITGFFCLAVVSMHGQSIERWVIGSAGDCNRYPSGMISWTAGEMATETFSAGHKIVTGGFHQSSLKVSEISNDFLLRSSVTVYPNPAGSYIKVEIKNPQDIYVIAITDAAGRALLEVQLEEGEFEKRIDLSPFAMGVYMIAVKGNRTKGTDVYKIVKQ